MDEAEVADEVGHAGQAVEPRGSKPHWKRFLLIYAALALVLAGAAGALVLLLAKGGPDEGPAWSAWRPEGDEDQMAQQIAAHVASGYRLPSGQQLVSVQAAPPRVQNVPLGAIAIRRPPGLSPDEAITVLPVDNTVVYILCGLGQNCAIEEGEPSTERLLLLRREALELALYTFRYLEKDRVVAFLPPPPGQQPSFALFFQRGDLTTEIDQPLRTTLPHEQPPQPEAILPAEIATIDRLTEPRFFRFSFQQLQDGTAVLVLDDPSLPPPEQQQQQQPQAEPPATTGEQGASAQ
jgi:hypothetical protein